MTVLRLILLCFAIVLAVAVIYAGLAAGALFAVWFLDGGLALLWTGAGIGLGLWLMRLVRLETAGSLRYATAGGLGLGVLALAVLGLGLAGWLSRPSLGLLAIAGLCGWLPVLREIDAITIREAMRRRPTGWAIWLVPAVVLGVALVAVAIPPGILWNSLGDPHAYDVLEYHLQVPREWYELGRIVPLKHNAFSYFPFGMEMHFLAMMHLAGGPWAGMYAAQFMSLAHMVLAALAIHGITVAVLAHRGIGTKGSDTSRAVMAAAVAVTAFVAVPWTVLLGTIAYNEAGLLLYAALAIAWTIRQETTSRQWIMGGAFAGLACGCKYTGVPMMLILWPLALLGSGQWQTAKLKRIVLYCAVGMATFSPWLVRNLIWTGNPVFPEATRLLGRAHFSEGQVQRWEAAHTVSEKQRPVAARLEAFGREVFADGRYGYVFWPLAIAAIIYLWRRREARTLAVFILLLAVFWLGVTHVQSRFYVVAVVPAAILIGILCGIISSQWWIFGVAAASLVLAAPLFHGALWPAAQFQAFGLYDLSRFDEAIKTRCESGRKLALVGDARAFLYVMPMANLRYRTVFDVDQKPGQGLVDAWLGSNAAAIRGEYQIVEDRGELLRFSRTYRNISFLP